MSVAGVLVFVFLVVPLGVTILGWVVAGVAALFRGGRAE